MISEASIARAIQRTVFQNKCILLVPNVAMMVHEADILGVTPDGRLIDIEIKISRADLKADARKTKWWETPTRFEPPIHRPWPPRIWKHYYVMPQAVWRDDLAETLGSPMSGVLTITEKRSGPVLDVVRRSKPNRQAEKLTAEQMLDVARLANIRMWEALASVRPERPS